MVDIVGLDKQADGGTHVRRTDEVGPGAGREDRVQGQGQQADPPRRWSTPDGAGVPVELDGAAGALAARARVVVAFSGGVDSGLLAWVAHDVLGPERAVAVTAVSPSLAPSELADCRPAGRVLGAALDGGRERRGRPARLRRQRTRPLLPLQERADGPSGAGRRGRGGGGRPRGQPRRPGRPPARASRPPGSGARSSRWSRPASPRPTVRQAARQLGLAVWDKPAAACLASRVPYGTPVTLGTLDPGGRGRGGAAGPRVPRAAGAPLRRPGPPGVRRRTTWSGPSRTGPGWSRRCRAAGYRYVTLDLEGLRSGNLNDAWLVAAADRARVTGRLTC